MHCPFMVVCLWVLVHAGPDIFLYTMIRDIMSSVTTQWSNLLFQGFGSPSVPAFLVTSSVMSITARLLTMHWAHPSPLTTLFCLLCLKNLRVDAMVMLSRNYRFCSSVVSLMNVFHIPFLSESGGIFVLVTTCYQNLCKVW